MRTAPGYSLLELALALALTGLLLLLATPPLQHARDVFATRAARDQVLTQIAYTRSLAAAHAGAELVVAAADGRLEVRSGEHLHHELVLSDRYGVDLSASGQQGAAVVLRFDALGIGRMANRTLTLTRGSAQARISISAYGRARPW